MSESQIVSRTFALQNIVERERTYIVQNDEDGNF